MSRSIVGRLVAKDLYLYRWMIVAALLVGAVSVPLMGVGPGDGERTGVNFGVLLFMTNLIAFGVFVVMYGAFKERQDRSLLFVLSLPVSPMQYTAAKLLAGMAAFLVPWTVLTAGTVALTAWAPDAPDGRIPSFVAMMAFFLANFSVLLALVQALPSERWAIFGILATNMAVPLYLGRFMALPGVAAYREAENAVWSPPVLASIGASLALAAIALALALYVQSRRKDQL